MYLYYYYFSFPMILISNIMIFFFKSFIYMWMIMEFNLMCFLSMVFVFKFKYNQMLMDYFLVQSYNSYLFLMSSVYLMIQDIWLVNLLMLISLSSKMGVPPFHIWYLSFMKNLNWMLFYLNSSLQKFIPLMIMSVLMKMSEFLLIYMIFLLFFLPLLGINFVFMKIVMSISSLIQVVWLIILMNFNKKMWMIYYLYYCIISFALIYLLNLLNVHYVYDLVQNKGSVNVMYLYNFMIFSLASLPPFSGFLNKMMFMDLMVENYSNLFLLFMFVVSLLNMYFYLRIMFINSLIYYSCMNKNVNWNKLDLYVSFKVISLNLVLLMLIMFYEMF
uniref:NADH dehydrogenase subunit 2 n=1 Tax=Tassonia gloriae TaxID=3064207 RepID=UPI00286D4DE2|nr:NADH dehydrogenase subunit 2 [Tassonia gloriae]WKV28885.1 NADH dehydrogenase subunit 2 [Tassonia gloriae]